jgi:hypothetical protein
MYFRCLLTVMSRDQNARRSYNIKINNSSFQKVEELNIWKNLNKSKFYSGRTLEQTEVSECLLSFGAELFVFQFVIRKYKD